MAQKIYNKLIRDRIPEIIEHDDRQYEVSVLSDVEYDAALRDKLVEEAQEGKQAADVELIIELADLMEVILALMELHSIGSDDLEAERQKRREARGGFEKRLKLVWAD